MEKTFTTEFSMLPAPAALVETSVKAAGVASPSACRLKLAQNIMAIKNRAALELVENNLNPIDEGDAR